MQIRCSAAYSSLQHGLKHLLQMDVAMEKKIGRVDQVVVAVVMGGWRVGSGWAARLVREGGDSLARGRG